VIVSRTHSARGSTSALGCCRLISALMSFSTLSASAIRGLACSPGRGEQPGERDRVRVEGGVGCGVSCPDGRARLSPSRARDLGSGAAGGPRDAGFALLTRWSTTGAGGAFRPFIVCIADRIAAVTKLQWKARAVWEYKKVPARGGD
jgi:hypothetical protein